jgi:hypothetical protein
VSGSHIVVGTAVTNTSGNGSVTFAGSAVYTSATSYECTLTPESTGASPTTDAWFIASKTTTGFTFKASYNSTTFDYICIGN